MPVFVFLILSFVPFGRLSAGFALLSAGFGGLSAGFAGKIDEKNEGKRPKLLGSLSELCLKYD